MSREELRTQVAKAVHDSQPIYFGIDEITDDIIAAVDRQFDQARDTEIREFLDDHPEVFARFLRREARRDPRWLRDFLEREARIRGATQPGGLGR